MRAPHFSRAGHSRHWGRLGKSSRIKWRLSSFEIPAHLDERRLLVRGEADQKPVELAQGFPQRQSRSCLNPLGCFSASMFRASRPFSHESISSRYSRRMPAPPEVCRRRDSWRSHRIPPLPAAASSAARWIGSVSCSEARVEIRRTCSAPKAPPGRSASDQDRRPQAEFAGHSVYLLFCNSRVSVRTRADASKYMSLF